MRHVSHDQHQCIVRAFAAAGEDVPGDVLNVCIDGQIVREVARDAVGGQYQQVARIDATDRWLQARQSSAEDPGPQQQVLLQILAARGSQQQPPLHIAHPEPGYDALFRVVIGQAHDRAATVLDERIVAAAGDIEEREFSGG